MDVLMQEAIELVQCMRIAALVTWGVAVLALKARILSRAISRAGLWWDDWLLVPAIVGHSRNLLAQTDLLTRVKAAASAICFITSFWVTGAFLVYLENARVDKAGVTQSLNATAEAAYQSYVEGFWVSEICWTLAICMIKLSILTYYWRVFTPSRGARHLILALMAVVACWAVAVTITTVLQCRPVSDFWNPHQGSSCIDSRIFPLASTIPHMATDVALLMLPLPWIWRIADLKTSHKWILSTVFALGIFATLVSCVRLLYLIPTSMSRIKNLMWTNIEVNVAIICGECMLEVLQHLVVSAHAPGPACLPSLRPLVSALSHLIASIPQSFGCAPGPALQIKSGPDLLVDMLPKKKGLTITPLECTWVSEKHKRFEMETPITTPYPTHQKSPELEDPMSEMEAGTLISPCVDGGELPSPWRPAELEGSVPMFRRLNERKTRLPSQTI